MKVYYRCYLTGHTDIALSSAEPEHLHLVGCGNQITLMSLALVLVAHQHYFQAYTTEC